MCATILGFILLACKVASRSVHSSSSGSEAMGRSHSAPRSEVESVKGVATFFDLNLELLFVLALLETVDTPDRYLDHLALYH